MTTLTDARLNELVRFIDTVKNMSAAAIKLIEENNRLKRGDFTPEEFQHLCHKFQDADLECFGKGCEDYQRKLFGKCWRDAENEQLRTALGVITNSAGWEGDVALKALGCKE